MCKECKEYFVQKLVHTVKCFDRSKLEEIGERITESEVKALYAGFGASMLTIGVPLENVKEVISDSDTRLKNEKENCTCEPDPEMEEGDNQEQSGSQIHSIQISIRGQKKRRA